MGEDSLSDFMLGLVTGYSLNGGCPCKHDAENCDVFSYSPALDFKVSVRDYLERKGDIQRDDIVEKVVVTNDDVRVYRRA